MDTDRNLLFGVLALRAGLVDVDQFAGACEHWARQKRHTLAEVLTQSQGLRGEDLVHLEYLLDRHSQNHRGSARAALAALADANVRSALGSVRDPALREWIAAALPGGLWLEPDARVGRRLRPWFLAGGIGLLLLAVVLGGAAILTNALMSRQWQREQRALLEAERALRMEADLTAAAGVLDHGALDRALRTLTEGDNPASQQLREKFLLEYLAALQERHQADTANKATLRAVTEAHDLLADYYLKAKNLEKARFFGEATLNLRENYQNQMPQSAQSRRELAQAQEKLASIYQQNGNTERAEPLLRDAIVNWQQASGMGGSRTWAADQREVAKVWHQLAQLAQGRGKLDEAEQHYHSADATWQIVVRQPGNLVIHLLEQARCSIDHGKLLLSRQRAADAERILQGVTITLEGLSVEAAQQEEHRKLLAAARTALVTALKALGRKAEADEFLQKLKKSDESKQP